MNSNAVFCQSQNEFFEEYTELNDGTCMDKY